MKDFKTEDINIAFRQLNDRYDALKMLIDKYPKEIENNNIKEKLVVTDLFVEKDILVLEKRANKLQSQAKALYIFMIITFCLAAGIAIFRMFSDQIILEQKDHTILWINFTIITIKAFTTYGLLVLIGATAWKQSKAKYDQAERLYAKRRQNRQLRLFIHLNDGKITHKEFLEFLEFAQGENNAYEQIKAEAKAPLGNLVSDLLKTQANIIKALTPKEKNSL
jgi:hypothetical protein